MKIQRKRWVIIRKGGEIFCGLTENFMFRPIDNVGDMAVKTYLSKDRAEVGFRRSWWKADREDWKAVEVIETIESEVEE